MLLKKLKIAAANADHRRRMREEERDKKREEEREKKRAFLENGGLVLEKLVACCNGRPIPIRTFSYQQLVLATHNFINASFYLENGGIHCTRVLLKAEYFPLRCIINGIHLPRTWP